MRTLVNHPGYSLGQLLDDIDNLPASSPEPPLLYNHQKLSRILERKEMLKYTDDATLNEVLTLTSQYSHCTSLLNQNQLEGALHNICQIDLAIEEKFLNEAYLYAKQWGVSVKALYYYKKKMYTPASSLSLECLVQNEHLIRAGVTTLLFRALEQNINISRIFTSMGDAQRGANFYGDIINYLLNGEAGQLYGSVFREKTYWEATPYLREASALENFKRAVYALIRHCSVKNRDEREAFYPLFGQIKEFAVDTPERQVFYNWLYLKNLFLKQKYRQFISDFLEFMQEPLSKSFDALKLSLFQNVIQLIEWDEPNNQDLYVGRVTNFINQKMEVIPDLKQLVCGKQELYFPTAQAKIINISTRAEENAGIQRV